MPVFVDVDRLTHNIDASKIEAAIGPKTKAIMLAHNDSDDPELFAYYERRKRKDSGR